MHGSAMPRAQAAATEHLTVLECEDTTVLAKRFVGAERKKLDYGNAYYVKASSHPLNALADLLPILEELRASPHACIIRGTPIDGVDHDHADGAVRRIAQPKPRIKGDPSSPIDPAAFASTAHHANMLDDDGKSGIVFDAHDLRGTAELWRSTLPACLHNAEMLVSFSASQRPGEIVRVHAWFWSETALADIPLRRWAHRNKLDRGIYSPVQPHYTADPIFEGCADPLPSREIIHLQGAVASLDFSADDMAVTPPRSFSAKRAAPRLSVTLDELPEPRGDVVAIKAREQIAAPLEPLFSKPGNRWDACGYVGGACANAGLPPEECVAILESLQWDDVDDEAAASGVAWALGAYDCAVEPKGISGIAELARRAVPGGIDAPGGRFSGREVTALKFEHALAEYSALIEPKQTKAVPTPVDGTTRLGRIASLATPPEPIHYVCEGLGIAPGKVSSIGGYAGTGKGPLLDLFAVCVASGREFLGHKVERRKVCFLDAETGALVETRLKRIANGLNVDLAKLEADDWFTLIHAQPPIDEEYCSLLESMLERDMLLCVDSYTSAVFGDQNDATIAETAFRLGRMSSALGVAVIVATHEKKGQVGKRGGDLEMMSGHNALAAAMQAAITLTRPDDKDKALIEVRCARAPEEPFDTFRLRWEDVPQPDARDTRGGRLKAAKWGLRAVLEENEQRPATVAELKAAIEACEAPIMAMMAAHYPDGQQAAVATIIGSTQSKGAADRRSALRNLIQRGRLLANYDAHSGRGGRKQLVWLPTKGAEQGVVQRG